MKLKKLSALLLAAVMMVGVLAGCGGGKTNSGDDTGLKTVAKGKLTVAISPDFAPTVFVDPTKEGQDRYVGTDASLIRYIAQQMGLELVIAPMSFEACQVAVSTGQVDFSVNGYAGTEKRAENYLFSDKYNFSEEADEGHICICMAPNADKWTAESIPAATSIKIGVQNSSLQESLTREQLPNAEIVYFSDLNTGIMQLRNGDFDCMTVDSTNGKTMMAANPDIVATGFRFVYEDEGTVALFQKGNDALCAEFNKHLATAKPNFAAWLAEAKELANIGVEVSLDENGNEIK